MKSNFLLILSFFFLFSCDQLATEEQKKSNQKEQIEKELKGNLGEAKEDLNNAFKNVGEALKNLKEKNNIDDKEPVNFREMKEILPRKLSGMKMEDSEGQTTGVLGFKISNVKAIYQEDNSELEVKIIDVAGVGKLLTQSAAWTKLDIDKESKDGYERTTTIDGYKAYEKYDGRRQKGQIAMLVDDRFVVDIRGKNVTEQQLKDAMEDINLRKLKKLGN